ncbi:tRNA (guanosine(37)-N1)-methyltransferase TrmD [uncultured Gimesia sp.]|uniref:tRNA (guanosine(37)-N1)-methyltransferase TrmD n=1 Tax=uncultured Gimesia sp. TaxID=1678688 RepID=UPI0026169D7E|nr:tRNA (guanosine(37)-N1)-methyltransferase TrmD [uncultured Gimesia sp.]
MRFDILTLFPELFDSYLEQGLLRRAIQNQIVEIQRWNFRDWATDKHASVDDRPYGGGPGMLIGCETVFGCVEHVRESVPEAGKLIMLTPQGRTLNQSLAQELSKERQLTLLCGRYEGFDERIRIGLEPMEISAGDFITNGGEVPAMLIIETVIRLIPGVLGDESSAKYDSFSESGLLEHPQYTRPQNFRGMEVPEVLLSGNHQEIARWRQEQSLIRTRERRNDLLTESESNSI